MADVLIDYSAAESVWRVAPLDDHGVTDRPGYPCSTLDSALALTEMTWPASSVHLTPDAEAARPGNEQSN